MRILRWLLSGSIVRFSLASIASVVAGLLTISVLILLFRRVGRSDEVRLELFSVLCVCAIGSRSLSRSLTRSVSRRAISSLRVELFRRIMAAPLAEIERVGRSKLTLALTDDIGRIAAVVPTIAALCANVTLIFGCLAYLGWLSRVQLSVTLIVIAVGIGCDLLARREGTKQMRVTGQQHSDLLEVFRSALDGLKELKLHSTRREEAQREFAKRASELESAVERQALLFYISALAAQTLFYLALGLAMFAAGEADHQVVVSYGIAIIYLMGPLQGSVQMTQELVAANVALERVEELGLSLERARPNQGMEQPRASLVDFKPPADVGEFRQLELVGVTYSYESGSGLADDEFILGPIDLVLERSDILFIVGGNGSGKTTLAKILAGLYVPSSGTIRINGHDVIAADTEWYSQLISAIFHDFFVFDRLAHGNEWPDSLLRRFEIDGRVEFESNKISKPSALSVGERKRLALMFAYLDDKQIFILDEWAADQDPSFKERFYKEFLLELSARGKLVVVISHDDRYFKMANKILFLDRGKPSLQLAPGTSNAELI
jgi:putative pyoverdin transport system ATP-binding/permease protein